VLGKSFSVVEIERSIPANNEVLMREGLIRHFGLKAKK
jgi:hypothetical protein